MTVYSFKAQADNYEPPRECLVGTLTTWYDSRSAVLLFTDDAPAGAFNAVYILDHGTHVDVRYVAGYNADTLAELYLSPIPVNPDGA